MRIKNLPYCIQKHLQRPEYVAISSTDSTVLSGLFIWKDSPISDEGQNFWEKINNGDYKEFFRKYSEDITSDFIKYSHNPSEKPGTEYIVVKTTPTINLVSGETVVLDHNDGSTMPHFTSKETKRTTPILWTRLVYKNPNNLLIMNDNNKLKDDGGFKTIPKNVKLGDCFKIVSYNRMHSPNSAKSYFEELGLKMGDIISLSYNDGSTNPKFEFNGIQRFINWGCLAPVDKSDIEKPNTPDFEEHKLYPDEVIGTKYECIGSGKSYYQPGDIVEYKRNNGSSAPLFYNPRYGKDVYIPWCKLKRINSLNLNSKEDGINEVNNEHRSTSSTELFLHAVSATVSYGDPCRGTSISCASQEIRMGS